MSAKAKDAFAGFANIGPATRKDLDRLSIATPTDLAGSDADELYLRLGTLTGERQDPCVWDVFAAIIHQARTGEPSPWWSWTAERKRRQAAGTFCTR